jgi:hypothetical protein
MLTILFINHQVKNDHSSFHGTEIVYLRRIEWLISPGERDLMMKMASHILGTAFFWPDSRSKMHPGLVRRGAPIFEMSEPKKTNQRTRYHQSSGAHHVCRRESRTDAPCRLFLTESKRHVSSFEQPGGCGSFKGTADAGSLSSYPGPQYATAFAVSGPRGHVTLHNVTSSGIDLTRPFPVDRLIYPIDNPLGICRMETVSIFSVLPGFPHLRCCLS